MTDKQRVQQVRKHVEEVTMGFDFEDLMHIRGYKTAKKRLARQSATDIGCAIIQKTVLYGKGSIREECESWMEDKWIDTARSWMHTRLRDRLCGNGSTQTIVPMATVTEIEE